MTSDFQRTCRTVRKEVSGISYGHPSKLTHHPTRLAEQKCRTVVQQQCYEKKKVDLSPGHLFVFLALPCTRILKGNIDNALFLHFLWSEYDVNDVRRLIETFVGKSNDLICLAHTANLYTFPLSSCLMKMEKKLTV